MLFIFVILLYQMISIIVVPVIPFYLLIRLIRKKESIASIVNRFGLIFPPSSKGKKIIWIHVASVGEARSCFYAIKTLIDKNFHVHVTVMTQTSYKITRQYFNNEKGVSISFAPFDSAVFVILYLLLLRPSTFILVESEIWPNYILCSKLFAKKRYLLNARMSANSIRKWEMTNNLGINIFKHFTAIFTSQESYLSSFLKFNKNSFYKGNMKLDYVPMYSNNINESKAKAFCRNNAKTILLSSTHEGEEGTLLSALLEYKKNKEIKIILAPRHINRVQRVEEICNNYNLKTINLSALIAGKDCSNIDCLIIDQMGVMATFYDASDLVFVCGSFVDGIGGHNPLEAVSHKKPVIMGVFHANCKETADTLKRDEALLFAECSVAEITSKIDYVFNNYQIFQDNINKFLNKQHNVFDKILTLLDV